MKNKNAIAMPFNWIFAIIVGAIILFLAIYATAKFISTSQYQINTETAAKLTALLDPMGTGLASGKSTQINFKKETRTYYECSDLGQWGEDSIAFSEKVFSGWGEKGGEINTKKYVFSEKIIEGKKLNLLSKSFFMPFKVGDIIVISGKDYCFYQAPDEIREEVEGLGVKNIKFSDNLENCTGISVCFESNICDINVYGLCEDYNCKSKYDYGKVFKEQATLYYDNSLLYAAIMSSPEIYECNLRRLMKRFIELSNIYIDKIEILEVKHCSSTLKSDLINMKNLARDLEDSEDLFILSKNAEKMDAKNNAAICKLW